MTTTADTGQGTESGAARLRRLVGGTRGLVEGGVPPITFMVTHAVTAQVGSDRALTVAIVAAVGAALALAAAAVVQGRSVRQALSGLAGVAVAAGFAAWADDVRAFFLPGIWVDAGYAVAFAVSVLVGRPLVGTVHGWLLGRPQRWWEDRRVRRTFGLLTLGWAGLYALRAGVQTLLYAHDEPELMAVAKIALGWPLTVVAVGLTLAWLRRTPAAAA